MHMSTKIYTAFRLPGYTLERALHKLQAFQLEVLVPVAQQACHRKVVSEAVARLDAHHCGLDTEKPRLSPMAEAWSDLMGRANDIVKPGRRDPSVDFDFEVTLFPFDDAILGISFTEQSDFHALWLAQSDVEEYGYWNNTDKPETVSESEWESRADAWDVVLPGYATPAQSGLALTLCVGGALLAYPVEDVDGLLPSSKPPHA
jgi:hypothetical protein